MQWSTSFKFQRIHIWPNSTRLSHLEINKNWRPWRELPRDLIKNPFLRKYRFWAPRIIHGHLAHGTVVEVCEITISNILLSFSSKTHRIGKSYCADWEQYVSQGPGSGESRTLFEDTTTLAKDKSVHIKFFIVMGVNQAIIPPWRLVATPPLRNWRHYGYLLDIYYAKINRRQITKIVDTLSKNLKSPTTIEPNAPQSPHGNF